MIKRLHAWFDRQAFISQVVMILLFIFGVRTALFGLYSVPTGSMETTMLVGERFLADKLTLWFCAPKRGEIISFNDPNYEYSENKLVNWWQRYVWGPTNWTKRVIGIPGDHVEGKIEDGVPVVYRNGEKLVEPYLNTYPLIAVWTPQVKGRPYMYFSYDPKKPFSEQPFYKINPRDIVHNPKIPQVLEPQTPLANGSDVFDVQLGDNEYWVMGDNRLGSYDSRGFGKLDGKLIHGRMKFCIFSLDSLHSWWIFDLLRHPLEFWSQVRWNRCFKFVR